MSRLLTPTLRQADYRWQVGAQLARIASEAVSRAYLPVLNVVQHFAAAVAVAGGAVVATAVVGTLVGLAPAGVADRPSSEKIYVFFYFLFVYEKKAQN
jgi:hypothetical protein